MGHSSERNNGVRGNWKCILICLAMSLANCQYGYDTGTIAGFQAMVGFLKIYGYRDKKMKTGWNIATTRQQLIASFLNVGTIIGLLLTPIFAKRFGRRPGIWVACIISFVASALQLGTTSLAGLYAGRIFIGVSNGFFITFANSYTAESSPAHLRGIIVSFFGIWVNTGSLLGAITGNFSKDLLTKLSYHIPLASLYATPFFLGILIIFIPESPRWLLIQNRPDEARKSLERLRGNSLTPELIEEEFIEMKRGIDSEQELAQGRQYTDMFKGTDLRRTLLCFAVILSHASSGLWLIISYGTFFFQIAGIKEPFKASIYTKVANLVGTGTGMYFCLKWMGRRTMMMTGHFLPALFMLGIAVAFTVAPDSEAAGKALVVCALGYCFFYNGFSGTLSWPLLNEIVSSRLRVITIGLGTAITYVFNWLITFTTPYFINSNELNWGPKAAYIWAVSNLITGIFFFFFLPEMKGRTLEEIDELFQNRVSVRNFRKYEFISSSKARQAAIETRKELNCDNQTESSKEPEVTHAEEVQV